MGKGQFVAECPALPGCVSQGKDKMQAIYNIKAAIRTSLRSRRELQLPTAFEVMKVEVASPTA